MKFCNCILKIAEIASLICGLPIVAFIFYCEFFGYDSGNAFLNSIHFPLSDNGLILVGYICAGTLLLSIICKKFFSDREV